MGRRLNLQYQHLIDYPTVICMFIIVLIFLLLFEPRCSKRVYYASLIPVMALWLGGNIYVLLVYGLEVLGRYTLLTATLPSMLYFWIVAKTGTDAFSSPSAWWTPWCFG